MRIAVLSDTHVPARAPEIPDWVLEELSAADHVIHAGDYDSPEAYETVVEHAPELTAVAGNMDPRNIDVPEVATLDAGGVRFVVVHGTGPLETYRERVAGIVAEEAAADRPTVGVAGHTHERMDETVDGHRLLNPGSATGADPASEVSMLVGEVDDGAVSVESLVR